MGFTREKDVSAGGTVEGLSCLAEYTAEKKLHMKEMYEVLKFIETRSALPAEYGLRAGNYSA